MSAVVAMRMGGGDDSPGEGRGASILDLPYEVLARVAAYLAAPAVPGVTHDLSTWRQVCGGFRAVPTEDLWLAAWQATRAAHMDHAGRQLANEFGKTARERERVIRTFRAEVEAPAFTAEACLELGLLPQTLPPWCRTAVDVERALLHAVQFCCFQVTVARGELQTIRGSIPVIESFAVVASIAHCVFGGIGYLRSTSRELPLLTPPMYRIFGSWALFLLAYALYRIRLKRIKRIPARAVRMWNLQRPSSQGTGVRYLLYDYRFTGALCWTACLFLSIKLWETEVALGRGLTPGQLMYIVLLPPTFAATLVAWQRSGKRIGLHAGALVGSTLLMITYFPSTLFLGLLLWSVTVTLNAHQGYYHPPRTHLPKPLLPVAKGLGSAVIYSITLLSISWFACALDTFFYALVGALAILAAWVATAVFIPLYRRCRALHVTPPLFYVSGQALVSVASYLI